MPITSRRRPTPPPTVHLRAAAILVVAVVITHGPVTVAATSARAARPVDHETGLAVAANALAAARSLAGGDPGIEMVGTDIVRELGYAPVSELGLASRASGDCSSPVPLPTDFEPACRIHDLGYDLLRLAHRRGGAIPPGLRSDLDSLLARQMRDACGSRAWCLAAAEVAHLAVRVNTMRQGHGAPVGERLPW